MKVLAIDTSSKNCSVAIIEVSNQKEFKVLAFGNNDDEKTHSQKLMPIVDKLFNECNLSVKDMDILACCLGPGSFTGIRIGIATVKAFADVTNLPTVGVTSLESLAYNECSNGFVCPIIDCRNENVYSALFSGNNNSYLQIGNNMAESIYASLDKLIETLTSNLNCSNTITFVGDGSVLYKDLITEKFASSNQTKNYNLIFADNNTQSSISLAKCAYEKYLNKDFGDSNHISPLYLRKSQAERAKNGEH